jgi:hypothetical protein
VIESKSGGASRACARSPVVAFTVYLDIFGSFERFSRSRIHLLVGRVAHRLIRYG